MSRFTRFSRISPLELCLERERRAWRCGIALAVIFLAVAVAGLFSPAPERWSADGQGADFAGFLVTAAEREPEPEATRAHALPPTGAVAVAVEPVFPAEMAATLNLPLWPDMPEFPEWKVEELAGEGDALVSLTLPEELPAPASAPRPRASAMASASSGTAAGGKAAARADGEAEAAGELIAARYRLTPRPPYPPSLLSRRVQGEVGLRIEIDDEGVPRRVEVSSTSGHTAFDRSAREWVLAHWRFHPARRGARAVASVVHTRVEFCLR